MIVLDTPQTMELEGIDGPRSGEVKIIAIFDTEDTAGYEGQHLTFGLGYEADPFVRGQDRDANGKFVESEGAKNRRVIVMDAEDPIAREILDT